MEEIDKLIKNNNIKKSIEKCYEYNFENLAIFLEKISFSSPKYIRIKLLCNWCSSEELSKFWSKMCKTNYTWNNIKLVLQEPIDYYIIINKPLETDYYQKNKSIIFQMEPYMNIKNNIWGSWSNPEGFLKVFQHCKKEYNNNEWHLSWTYNDFLNKEIQKTKSISIIISKKYKDIGHIKRIDFLKFLEKKNFTIDVYGDNYWDFKNYIKSLPYHEKDEGLFPYKYTINAENNEIPYYYTEKLIDGIMTECLTFYWGCPNI